MNELLTAALPRQTWENRLIAVGTQRFFELGALDVELLLGLGIKVDRLGPRLVVCMWDEASDVEIGGYLVVDNLAMGSPSLGGIRMLGDITPATVHNLARGMTLKNAAAGLPFGGGKSGICAQGDRLSTEERDAVIRGFGRLIYRYRDLYNPGPDVGTSDADMKTIAIENGLDFVVSKPVEMGGNRIDQLGGAAWGVVLAIKAVLDRIELLLMVRELCLVFL
jgi:glutamate dehydrogenase (NAD(P)+)